MDEDVRRLIEDLGVRMEAGFAELRGELRSELAETRAHSERLAAENRRHFGVEVEHLRGQIQLVAEGVMGVDERLTREMEKVDRRFDETHDLIRFAYRDLDRRVRVLEEK